jgi:hypothetical protein
MWQSGLLEAWEWDDGMKPTSYLKLLSTDINYSFGLIAWMKKMANKLRSV